MYVRGLKVDDGIHVCVVPMEAMWSVCCIVWPYCLYGPYRGYTIYMVHMEAMHIVCVVDSMAMWSVWCIFRLYGLCGAHGGYVHSVCDG